MKLWLTSFKHMTCTKKNQKRLIPMNYLEWKLNQELNGRSTFEKDEKFRIEYQEYIKNEYRKKPEPRS